MSEDQQQRLLHGENSKDSPVNLPVHPKLWAALGMLYVTLGLIQLMLAGMWRWYFGMFLGLAITKTGSSLIGIGLTGGHQSQLPPDSSIGAQLRHAAGAVILWGSTKIQKLFLVLRWPLYAYGVFIALLIAIHLSSPDPHFAAFPSMCPSGKRFGCARIADSAPYVARGMNPLRVNLDIDVTQEVVRRWLASENGATVLVDIPGFMHVRVVTLFWGFADDFLVGLRCDEEGHAVVEAQGQLRIGKSDLGVNARRNKRFYTWLEEQEEVKKAVAVEPQCKIGT